MEDELTFTIFNRSNIGVELTEMGKEFIKYAESILEQLSLIENLTNITRTGASMSLKISSQHFLFVIEILSSLQLRHIAKKFELLFKENEISAIIQDVANMETEIGIIGIIGVSNLHESFGFGC